MIILVLDLFTCLDVARSSTAVHSEGSDGTATTSITAKKRELKREKKRE